MTRPRSLSLAELNDIYAAKFNDSLPIIGIPDTAIDKAREAAKAAIVNKKPLTDAEFYEAIGVEPPPDGALI
jgi:hypothetical protein